MSTHTETVEWNALQIRVDFTFTKGSPEQGPTWSCGGQPAEPAEIEITRAVILGDDEDAVGELFARHFEALNESAYTELCGAAQGDIQDNIDAAAEARADLRREDRADGY